jgi:hypothetical protein
MSKKMSSSNSNETKMLFAKIYEARELAKQLQKLGEAVKSVTRERDKVLYNYFAKSHYIEKRLRRDKTSRNELAAQYERLPATKSATRFVLKLTHPGLNSKQQSRYAAVLRYVQQKKQPGQSVKSLIRAAGRINRCVREEKKLRSKPLGRQVKERKTFT